MVSRIEILDAEVVNLVTLGELEDGESYTVQMAGDNYAEVLIEERTDPDDADTGVGSVHLYPRQTWTYDCDHEKPSVAQLAPPYQPALLRISGPL